MLDYNKRIDASQGQKRITVKDLIEYLKTLNKDAKISVLGDPCFYIHVEQDGSEVIFDDSPLEDEYPMSYSMSDYLERNKAEEKSKKEANDLYEKSIKAQAEIPVDENKQEIQSAGPYMEAYLKRHFTKKASDDLKEMLTGKVNLDTFKEAYIGIGDCRVLFEAKMHEHLNRIVVIASPELLCIALVVKHRGRLKVIPQCSNNPSYLQEDKILSINGINFLVNNTIHSMTSDRFVIIDIFKLSELAKMVIPDAIEYLMNRKEYDAKNDDEATRVKTAYNFIIMNSKGKYGPLVPLVLPVKN